MSDRDSFIDEVSEEVRRDRLFALLRRYGWIAIAVVLLIVAGASWREWQSSRQTAQARAFGDAVLGAIDQDDPAAQAAALDGVEPPATPAGRALAANLSAAARLQADDPAAAAEALTSLADAGDIPAVWSDLARLKAVMLTADTTPPAERIDRLTPLAAPGAPYRLLAEEQIALAEIEAGDRAAAADRLRAIVDDAEVTAGMRARASQLLVALGESDSAA